MTKTTLPHLTLQVKRSSVLNVKERRTLTRTSRRSKLWQTYKNAVLIAPMVVLQLSTVRDVIRQYVNIATMNITTMRSVMFQID